MFSLSKRLPMSPTSAHIALSRRPQVQNNYRLGHSHPNQSIDLLLALTLDDLLYKTGVSEFFDLSCALSQICRTSPNKPEQSQDGGC